MNAVYKLPPFIPTQNGFNSDTSLSVEDMANLRSWGFNMVRLGMMWSATTPSGPGQFNTSYLTNVRGLVESMGEFGIYTLLDGHQDLFSRKFCGEGVPDWAVQPAAWAQGTFPFPIPHKVDKLGPRHYANITQCLQLPFVEWNLAAELQSSWYPLYHNQTLQREFAAHWGAVARVMNGSEYVLGYELLNEPLPCDGFHDLDVLCYLEPDKTDQDRLMPLYEGAWDAIRESDQHHIVFYEPSVVEGDIHQPTGFTVGPGGASANATQALAYHIYCVDQNAAGDITNLTSCFDNLDAGFKIAAANIEKVGGGHFMTEFGALGEGPTSIDTIHYEAGLADTLLESWAYWTFKGFHDITTQNPATESFYHPNGTLQSDKVAALSRTYAQYIAGVPGSISMSYASKEPARTFTLQYETNPSASNTTTVVYFNQDWHYPAGYSAKVVPEGALLVTSPERNFLHLTHKPGVQTKVTLVLTATQ